MAKAWDAAKLQKEVDAQVAITQAFSQTAPKTVASFAGTQAGDLRKQAEEAANAGDTAKARELAAEAAKWDEGGAYRVALHTAAGALSGGAGGAAGSLAAASAAPLLDKLQAGAEEALVGQGMSAGAAKMIAQGLAQATSAGMGAVVGGTQGAAVGLAVDTNNRQLHPGEAKWIKDNAKRFARQQGISEADAEKRLAQQAFREVQFGVEGQTDVAAQAFLKNNTVGMLLPGDPNIAGQNVGYMFRATPEQKANANMYLSQVLNSPETLRFYRDNQLKQPSLQQIVNAVQSDGAKRAYVLNKTVMAAVAAGALTLAPAFAGTAAEVAAFSKNPVGYCLANPAGCTLATETVTCAMAGTACPPASLLPNVRNTATKVVEKEVADATKAVNVAVNEAKAAKEVGSALTPIYKDAETGVATINPTASVGKDQLNRLSFDPDKGKVVLHEGNAAAQLENTFGGTLERTVSMEPGQKNPDFKFTSGPYEGKTVDFMWTDSSKAPQINKFFEKNIEQNYKQLIDHLGKADIVPLDFRNLSSVNQNIVNGWIRNLSPVQQAKIIIIR